MPAWKGEKNIQYIAGATFHNLHKNLLLFFHFPQWMCPVSFIVSYIQNFCSEFWNYSSWGLEWAEGVFHLYYGSLMAPCPCLLAQEKPWPCPPLLTIKRKMVFLQSRKLRGEIEKKSWSDDGPEKGSAGAKDSFPIRLPPYLMSSAH